MKHRNIKLNVLIFFAFGLITLQAQTVTDIDGNVYKTVTIGTQIWMTENLKTTKFNDGTPIPLASLEANDWANHTVAGATTPAYCWQYDSASVYKDIYGAFYNGFTVDAGNLCPTGWHVPSDEEWTILITYLGGENVAGAKLKEAGTKHWLDNNTGATNESGFTARGGGGIEDNGSNWNFGHNCSWWSSTNNDGNILKTLLIYGSVSNTYASLSSKQFGNPVRCVKDGTVETAAASSVVQEAGKPLSTTEGETQKSVTIRNDMLRFEVTVPGSWSFSKIVQQDPYEEMKSGSYSSSLSTGDGDKVPENWNGFRLSNTGPSYDASPALFIYGHKVGDQKPEDFSILFERSLTNFGVKDITINRNFSVGDAIGFDCIYNLGVRVRYTALYSKETRVVIQYFFPSNDPAQFDKYAHEIDKIIRSIIIK
jgi:uncharacterized protein (TIGR02145 family)